MREVSETFNIYTFESAPKELKEKITNYLSEGLYDHAMDERIDTLKALAKVLDANLDYSLSCVPDRGEFIRLKPNHDSLDFDALWNIIDVDKECPLTGVCYDHDIIDHLTKYNLKDSLNNALNEYINSIHEEYRSMLKDDYINDLCEANEYEFTVDGKIY